MDTLIYRPGNPSNLGSIVRTSYVLGMKRIFVYDDFSILENKDLFDRVKEVCRRGREKSLEIIKIDDAFGFIDGYKSKYATVISPRSKKLGIEGKQGMFFSSDPLIIFGNESEGVPRKISRRSGVERFVIPVINSDECFSLSEAYAIVLYEYFRQTNSLPKIKSHKP